MEPSCFCPSFEGFMKIVCSHYRCDNCILNRIRKYCKYFFILRLFFCASFTKTENVIIIVNSSFLASLVCLKIFLFYCVFCTIMTPFQYFPVTFFVYFLYLLCSLYVLMCNFTRLFIKNNEGKKKPLWRYKKSAHHNGLMTYY